MSQNGLTAEELEVLKGSLNSGNKAINIRLRQGEYQFELAKGIASFELELAFPSVKDLIGRSYGEQRTQDISFVRKIQTILKKMEKSNIVTILPKKKPWELQRYALTSFKFQDVEKNQIILATQSEIQQTLDSVYSRRSPDSVSIPRSSYAIPKIGILVFAIIISYAAILWALIQATIDPVIFVSAFCVATVCSILLGVTISRRKPRER